MRPTPIHKWELPGVPSGFEVFVKRDDMTGSTLGGNKVGDYPGPLCPNESALGGGACMHLYSLEHSVYICSHDRLGS